MEKIVKKSENGNISTEIYENGVMIENSWLSTTGYSVKREYKDGVVTLMEEKFENGDKNINLYNEGKLALSKVYTKGEILIKRY